MVAFHSFDLHRQHYQSEWHRFNLNRRVKSLPPVTESHYNTLTVPSEDSPNLPIDKKMSKMAVKADDPTSLVGISNEQEFEAVLRERLAKDRINVNQDCLFCGRFHGDSLEQVFEHMQKEHGLYIPDRDCLVDFPGLLQYLADKVAVGYCLSCADGRLPFSSLDAVRKHMQDKGHLKIRFDNDGSAELADFYDWGRLSTPSDDSDYEDVALITPDGTELVTVNGARIGNRAYFKYYKQYLRPAPTTEEEALKRQERLDTQLMIRQRGKDGQLALGTGAARLTETEKRDQRVSMADRLQEELAVGMKQNKFQPHFRLQIR